MIDDNISIGGPHRYELNVNLKLSEEDISRLVFHSALNLVNVLQDMIGSVRVCLPNHPELFAKTEAFCVLLGKSLPSFATTARLMQSFAVQREEILSEVGVVKSVLAEAGDAVNKKLQSKIQKTLRHLESFIGLLLFATCFSFRNGFIVPIFELRINELISRSKYPAGFWVAYHPTTLERNLQMVLQAVAATSGTSKARIVFDPAELTPEDYLVLLSFRASTGRSVRMPPVMQDCLRDLVLNARKYSFPGSTIRASMVNDGKELVLRVEDQGIGVDPAEVEQIVQFGFRGANAANRRTMGGGFGLTKAYYFTKLLGGSFFITTELGQGSIFEIHIPVPRDMTPPPSPISPGIQQMQQKPASPAPSAAPSSSVSSASTSSAMVLTPTPVTGVTTA